MPEKPITATRLHAELDEVLDRILVSGDAVVVTRDGRPVARLVPVLVEGPLAGTVGFRVGDDELIAPFNEPWSASSRSSGSDDGKR